MNLYAALAALLVLGTSWAGSVWWAYERGRDAELATQVREHQVAAAATQAAASAAAAAVARIKVQHKTVQQEVQREIQERVVYRDPACSHSPDQLQRINAALTGAPRPEPAGRGLVPRADAFVGPVFRRDDAQADRGGGAVP